MKKHRTLVAHVALVAVLGLGACATRSVPDAIHRGSALAIESESAPLDPPAVSLREDPPMPDEPDGAALWQGLSDPDAAVIPLPTEPGQAWGAQGEAAPHGGHHHAR
jgi:hypothetical protein